MHTIWVTDGRSSCYPSKCSLPSPSSRGHLFCPVHGVSARISLGYASPSLLQMPSSSIYQRKITAVGTVFPFPTWEAGTDGIFWKAGSSNLDFLDKEQGRAGHSHCPSGLSFSLWFIAPLGRSSHGPASAAGFSLS